MTPPKIISIVDLIIFSTIVNKLNNEKDSNKLFKPTLISTITYRRNVGENLLFTLVFMNKLKLINGKSLLNEEKDIDNESIKT